MKDEFTESSLIISGSESPEDVLSQLAYELRHPVNATKGWANLILKGMADSKEAAEQIYKIAEHVEVLLKAVIDYLEERGTPE